MLERASSCPGWYPATREEALGYLPPEECGALSALAFGVVPHAGWVYSGKIAGQVYARLKDFDTVIWTATNHTGLGPPCSVFPGGVWRMPWGPVAVDEALGEAIRAQSGVLEADVKAHLYEHAIEVQVPFLQCVAPQAKIVPIEVRDNRLETCRDLASAILKAVERRLEESPRQKIAVLASTDLTHCGEVYGQPAPAGTSAGEFARRQDRIAREKILALDPEGLAQAVRKSKITMCGLGPALAVLEAARRRGAKRVRVDCYANSAEASGPDSELAVGYAGILVE